MAAITGFTLMLRLAQLADIDHLLQLQAQTGFCEWSSTHFQQAITAQQCSLFVLKKKVVGFIVMSALYEQAELLNMAVDQAYQRQGLAKTLYFDAMQKVRQQGVIECLLEVASTNEAAKKLYCSLGFKPIASRKNYYRLANGLVDDALVMRVTYD